MDKRYRPQELAIVFSSAQNMMGLITWPSYVMCSMYLSYVELTTPYTPQQNGCAERKNRSLVEMTRCMLNDSGLPKKFWGGAIMTANHLQNRLPVDGKETTPYEGWNKRKPDLSYVKEFGSVAYVSIPTEKRQKLDDKARKLVFVGYEKGT